MTTPCWPGSDTADADPRLDRVHVWMAADVGVNVLVTEVYGQLMVLASTERDTDAAGVPPDSPCVVSGGKELAALVPLGLGLLVDRTTADLTAVSADTIDGWRVREAPHGDEVDLRGWAAPLHLRPMRDAAVAAALEAGATWARGYWMTGGGRTGLWIMVVRPSPAVLAAVHGVVARQAPDEAVVVVDKRDVPSDTVHRFMCGYLKEWDERPPGRPFTGWQNTVIVLVVLFACTLIGVGAERRDPFGTQLVIVGWVMNMLLLVGVFFVAAHRGFRVPGIPTPDSGDRIRLIPLLATLTVCGWVIWLAVP